MLTLLIVGTLIALGIYAHKVGIPAVIKKAEEVAARGEAAAEKVVAEIRSQTEQLKNANGGLTAPVVKPAAPVPAAPPTAKT